MDWVDGYSLTVLHFIYFTLSDTTRLATSSFDLGLHQLVWYLATLAPFLPYRIPLSTFDRPEGPLDGVGVTARHLLSRLQLQLWLLLGSTSMHLDTSWSLPSDHLPYSLGHTYLDRLPSQVCHHPYSEVKTSRLLPQLLPSSPPILSSLSLLLCCRQSTFPKPVTDQPHTSRSLVGSVITSINELWNSLCV